ncbi:MAG: multiple antibiotic resistance protein, partial [Pseudohongiellaceae bacterium]
MDWNEYTRMFVGIFAIVSPLGAVPLYLSFTENIKSRRDQVARTTALAVSVIFTVSMLFGQ